jgi:glycosyltransferase involved in cell wall biosynthesis
LKKYLNPDHRIGIDYTAAIHQQAGIGRYVRDLTGALAALQPDVPFRLFVAGGRQGDLPAPPGRCVIHPSALSERNHARLWHRLDLPIPVELWTGRIDLFHATDFFLPPTRSTTRTVLTIHDLAFERYPGETMPGMQDFLTTVVPRSVRRADHLIAVSEATRADLIDLYNTPPEKISVVAHGVDPRFRPDHPPEAVAAVRRKYGLPDDPLVLTVGTMQPRKNHRRLVQAFGRIKQRAALVIAGGTGWDYERWQAACPCWHRIPLRYRRWLGGRVYWLIRLMWAR